MHQTTYTRYYKMQAQSVLFLITWFVNSDILISGCQTAGHESR